MLSVLGLFGPGPPPRWNRISFAGVKGVIAPAGAYDADSIFDAETEKGNAGFIEGLWDPSALEATIDSAGIPYIGGAYTGRQQIDYWEYDRATGDYVAVTGGGYTATYTVGNASPVLGTIASQTWNNGVDSYADLDISDADDALSVLTLTGTISGVAITGTYNAHGIRTALHTYLPGDPGEYQKWRLEFSLAAGGGASSGTISDLAVADPYGGSATFAAFAWARVEGIQVPSTAAGTISYDDYVVLVIAADLVPSNPALVLDAVTAGNVVETDPSYPDYVEEGSLISIVVSGITVPDVEGLTDGNAVAVLTAAGFVAVIDYSGTGAPGRVSDQSVDAGSLGLPGDTITIYVALEIEGGVSSSTPRRRYYVEINGVPYEVGSREEANRLLEGIRPPIPAPAPKAQSIGPADWKPEYVVPSTDVAPPDLNALLKSAYNYQASQARQQMQAHADRQAFLKRDDENTILHLI